MACIAELLAKVVAVAAVVQGKAAILGAWELLATEEDLGMMQNLD